MFRCWLFLSLLSRIHHELAVPSPNSRSRKSRGKMAQRKKKKLNHKMNGKATTDKTTVSSEADLTSDEETSITKTTNQNT